MKKIFSLFFALAPLTNAYAQELNVPKGKTFEMTTQYSDPTVAKNEELRSYAFRSLGKNKEGNNVFECKLVKAIIKDLGQKRVYLNTDSLKKIDFMSSAVLFPVAMLQQPFTVTVSPKGKIISLDGVPEILSKAFSSWNLLPEIRQQINDNSAAGFNSEMQGFFYQFPAKSIVSRPVWENKDSGTKFKLTSTTGTTLKLTETAQDKDGGKRESRFAFDRNTGLILNAYSKTSFISKRTDPDGIEKSFTGTAVLTRKLGSKTSHAQLDTAWVNMAVQFSYWSDQLKTAGEYDSTKVKTSINKYEAAFKNDPVFMVRKLSLTQQLRTDKSYERYSEMLMTVPNKYLRGQDSHLHNKLGTALDKEGAASAYDVSKYVYDKDSFTQWLQHSFAQGFIMEHQFEGRELSEKKHHELLALLMADKNPVYVNKIRPMGLWIKAKQDRTNATLQAQTALAFNQMDDAQMKDGNGGRYALLMYNQLLDVGKRVEADTLLSKAINKLQRYTADTLNKERFASRNLLAHAYYLKFLSVVNSDSTAAMNYLARAAQYSPKSSKEKAYASFYDRVFLKSKESYRDDYIDKLLNGGNEKEALRLFGIQLSLNPESLDDMQKLYVKKFPKGDFRAFFIDQVVGSWEMAPEFNIKNISGKTHSLKDYKDKWLVLDFWGTWCGPCKEELPEVNKWYLELAEGKHGASNFLSIACYDTEEKVKVFLERNKYSIPVAMSDNKVERSYKVTGYPSKIIISPEGRMLNVQYGKDWKSFLKKFNEIYAAK